MHASRYVLSFAFLFFCSCAKAPPSRHSYKSKSCLPIPFPSMSPLQKHQETCTVCKQPIKGDSVVSNSKVFHPECMKCFVCGTGLRGQYFTYQDKPICEMHYKVRTK